MAVFIESVKGKKKSTIFKSYNSHHSPVFFMSSDEDIKNKWLDSNITILTMKNILYHIIKYLCVCCVKLFPIYDLSEINKENLYHNQNLLSKHNMIYIIYNVIYLSTRV